MKDGDKYRVSQDENENEVLPNKLELVTKSEVDIAEAKGFINASVLLTTELTSDTIFDIHYVHRMHELALGHLYSFAGKLRTVNISKGGFSFPASMHLGNGMVDFQRDILDKLKKEYGNDDELIEDIAKVHGELLFIHPYREGNGRTARLLANLMAYKENRDRLKFEKLDTKQMFEKYVNAVQMVGLKDYEPMKEIISFVL